MNRFVQWNDKYKVVWHFVMQNHRGPSRHRQEEHAMLNWMKFNRKKLNKDEMDAYRKEKFLALKALIHSFNRVNQYC